MALLSSAPRGAMALLLAQLGVGGFALVAGVLWGAESSLGAASICLLAVSLPCWAFALDGIWDPVSAARRRAVSLHGVGEYLVCGYELYRLEILENERAVVENCSTLELIEIPVEGLRMFASIPATGGGLGRLAREGEGSVSTVLTRVLPNRGSSR